MWDILSGMPEYQIDPETLQKLIFEIESLRKENAALREENKALREENKALREENAALRAKVQELEEKLDTNSHNSSKSPSQDPYRKRKSKKKPSGKKQGAQKGHQGHTRAIVPPEEVSEFKEVHPLLCPHCGGNEFFPEPTSTEVRQVTDLPEIRPHITQFNIHTDHCTCCNQAVKAEIPREAESAFGPRLKGFITLLSGEVGVTKRKIVSLIGYLNIKISVGSVCSIHHLAGKILEDAYETIREHTLKQTALNADETSWYLKGQRQWLWVITGVKSAFFKVDPYRSAEAFQRVFGESPQTKPLTTDRYGSYNCYQGPRQYCWSHIDRDFTKIEERGDIDGLVGKRLKEETNQVFLYWRHFQEGHLTRLELQAYVEALIIPPLKTLILLGSAGQGLNSKTHGTCKSLLSRFERFWTYLYYEGVEPTNNLAERDLRPSVIQRKLSYGTQSKMGSQFIERILSVVVTFKKQAKNAFQYLVDCFQAYSRDAPIPSPL